MPSGLIKDAADLYALKREDLLTLEGFAGKKADNLLDAISASKNQPLNRLITALGIRGVGEVMAADLAKRFRRSGRACPALRLADLMNIEGVGPNIAQAIVDWFSKEGNRHLLNKFRDQNVWPKNESRNNIQQCLPNH